MADLITHGQPACTQILKDCASLKTYIASYMPVIQPYGIPYLTHTPASRGVLL